MPNQTVQVMCRIQNGLRLTLGAPWFGGWPLALIDREPLVLQPGLNTLNAADAALWRAWAQDHADADVVTGRHVYEVKP
jgi:hypothetical protein